MAGLLPSFLSGSSLLIYIGNTQVAYGTNLSISQDMTQAGVGGIGSFSYDAIEPLMYSCRGSFTLTRYSNLSAEAAQQKTAAPAGTIPSRASVSALASGVDGNSLLHPSQFNPLLLIVAKTFDIKVFARNSITGATGDLTFTVQNARLGGYSLGFTPGSLTSESITFRALRVVKG